MTTTTTETECPTCHARHEATFSDGLCPACWAAMLATAGTDETDDETDDGAPAAAEPPAVNPAVARAQQPPPAPAHPSPTAPVPPAVAPAPNGRTYYGGRGQDGPPTTGKQLRQWSTKNGSLAWFDDFASKQDPPLPKFYGDWSDEWARFAHAAWLAACIPPAGPVLNGVAR